jgi:hypothetical protein
VKTFDEIHKDLFNLDNTLMAFWRELRGTLDVLEVAKGRGVQTEKAEKLTMDLLEAIDEACFSIALLRQELYDKEMS